MAEKKKLEESFNNPMKPEIKDEDVVRGTKGGPITLVEYSPLALYQVQPPTDQKNKFVK